MISREEVDHGGHGASSFRARTVAHPDGRPVDSGLYRLLYQEVFEFAPDSQFLTDDHGIILEANYAASAMLRRQKEFLVGKPLGLMVTEGMRGRFYECLLKLGQSEGGDEFESRLDCRGESREVFARAGSVEQVAGHRKIRWLIRDLTEQKAAENTRQELLRRLVEAEENERRRVSRELHDQLGQELTGLQLGLKALEAFMPPHSPGRARLAALRAAVDRIGHTAHDIAVELRPTVLDDVGLRPALEDLIRRWSERTEIQSDFHLSLPDELRLSPQVESTIYRVVQESLNNVAKHSESGRVSVIVERRDGQLIVLVDDDGRGFDIAATGPTHLGLLGMEERCALVGGSFSIESSPGVGTTVRLRIPLNHQARRLANVQDPHRAGG